MVLVGNKSDLTESRVITREQGVELAESLEIEYFEASVKNDTNVSETVDKLLDLIYPKEGDPEPETKPEVDDVKKEDVKKEDVKKEDMKEEDGKKEPVTLLVVNKPPPENKTDPINELNVETVPDEPPTTPITDKHSCWSTGTLLLIGCACVAVVCAWYFSQDN